MWQQIRKGIYGLKSKRIVGIIKMSQRISKLHIDFLTRSQKSLFVTDVIACDTLI